MRTESFRARRWAASSSLFLMLTLPQPPAAVAQEEAAEAGRYVRVPKSHANVHMGPTTARPVLVLVPNDTVLPVVGRRGEWIEVELSSELRESGMVLRWYENEERGWMHESTVEFVEEPEP